jgi:integrase/recombinase XerD
MNPALVTLKVLQHRNNEWLALIFTYKLELNNIARSLPGIKWSRQNSCWYLPLCKASLVAVKEKFAPVASIHEKEVEHYFKKQHLLQETMLNKQAAPLHKAPKPALQQMGNENLEALRLFVQQLKLKGYSNSTIETYRNEFVQLLRILGKKPVNDLLVDDIKRYMVYAMEKLGISENTAHSRINALKFYFEQVLGREKFFWEIPRPKKQQQLPKLLNEKELANLFNALSNKKHKAMLFTAYSAGLRVSEIVNLKIADIDSERLQIRIANAKGKKDRYVNLSPVLLDILRKYITGYTPKPTIFLFESEASLGSYSTRTVQQIFSNAKAKAGILKQVSFHSLRHSFATHLLDKGTDIKYIKDLLGHFDIRTTERYLHVSKQQLVNIVSPFDDLASKGKIEW